MGSRPRIRTDSPVAGLGRARLSFVQVLAQSISAVAPSAVMVTLPALVIPDAGNLTLAVFAVAALLMTMVGYCVGQFAHRMVAVNGAAAATTMNTMAPGPSLPLSLCCAPSGVTDGDAFDSIVMCVCNFRMSWLSSPTVPPGFLRTVAVGSQLIDIERDRWPCVSRSRSYAGNSAPM